MENRTNSETRTAYAVSQSHSTTPKINSKRQFRFIKSILENPQSINRLIRIVGANNVPEIARQLRVNGWQIETIKILVIDRDDELVKAGAYRLAKSQLQHAYKALKAFDIK